MRLHRITLTTTKTEKNQKSIVISLISMHSIIVHFERQSEIDDDRSIEIQWPCTLTESANHFFLPWKKEKEKVNSGASNLYVYTVTPIIRVMRHIKFGSCNIQINFYWVSSVFVLSLEFRLSSLKRFYCFASLCCASKPVKRVIQSHFICGSDKLNKLNELIDKYETYMEFIATLKTMEMLSLPRAIAIKRIASWLSMIPLMRQ